MTNFKGNNKLNSINSFFERTNYASNAFPQEAGSLYVKPVRNFLFAERMLYGRINNNHDVITVNEAFLKAIPSRANPKSQVQALSFVVNAFEDLVKEMSAQARAGRLNQEDPYLFDVKSHSSFVSSKVMYLNYLELLRKAFLGTFLTRERRQDIINFKTFLPAFFEFLTTVAENSSVSKPAFVASNLCSPMISGLSINVTDLDPSDDSHKQKFLNSPNFPYFLAAAKKYGFSIDQFVPWRLTADVGSPAMLRYSTASGASSSELIISRFFQKVGGDDLLDLQRLALEFYNSLVKQERNIRVRKETKVTIVCRPFATVDSIVNAGSTTFWLDKYIDLRYIEQRKPGSHGKVVELKKNCKQLLPHTGINYIITIINGAFKGFDNFEGSFAKTALAQGNNRDKTDFQPTY